MTAVVAPALARSVSPTLWAIAALLPLGPAAIAVLRLVLPYYTASDTAATLAARPGPIGPTECGDLAGK